MNGFSTFGLSTETATGIEGVASCGTSHFEVLLVQFSAGPTVLPFLTFLTRCKGYCILADVVRVASRVYHMAEETCRVYRKAWVPGKACKLFLMLGACLKDEGSGDGHCRPARPVG